MSHPLKIHNSPGEKDNSENEAPDDDWNGVLTAALAAVAVIVIFFTICFVVRVLL